MAAKLVLIEHLPRATNIGLPEAARGYGVAYRPGETNRCPGCGRQHWHVGRATAECAFCATALPIVGDGGER
ncbi:MAG: hypothetical protein IE921_00790 [Rhodobacteraceae bacterium]|nr:hypothetical protein [Paracoccaceae bacterium]